MPVEPVSARRADGQRTPAAARCDQEARPPATRQLSGDEIASLERDGFVILRGFYDTEREIVPIQRAIYDLIGLIVQRHGLRLQRPPFAPDTFDAGLDQLVAHDRRLAGEVYDLAKLVPAVVRLAVSHKNEAAFRQLRNTDCPGFAGRGYGVRMDLPGEHRFRALWHQEYLYQLRSLDGLTFWTPLVRMTPDMGPVVFARSSHVDGIFPVRYGGDPSRPGAYALELADESQIVGRYEQTAPLTEPGDLIVVDFRTLHCSGFNRSARARWSVQMRLFNFRDPTGIRIGWQGSVADGVRFEELFPEYLAPAAP